ncbi:DUF4097 family beta strand repeat-containing protein [Embleya scabrispora]|uniref:DUF4097 family beta strand repeat-containing protein n=1 Tax=Embleya scabrispora TaxID=159449 RepID=UPI00037FBFE5|nr:DUF4097 family beta strand repeat-containing protein [Embleya scabrispora]MYS83045.1 DUF4097 family beta strand repeat protein [Streptomyces sp. SID5474]
MPTFETPEPIFATVELTVGTLRISASDRTDTVVDVRPGDASHGADVQAAEQISVDFRAGRLSVKSPRNKSRSFFGRTPSVDVTIELPTGSRIEGRAATADIHAEGRIGKAGFTVAAGNIRLDRTGALKLNCTSGDVTVAHSVGHTDVTTAAGEIRIDKIDGTAVVRNTSGRIALGAVTGELRLNTTIGDITVDRALAGVGAKSVSGDVRIREVVHGAVRLETASGELEVGIRKGTAAWLDLASPVGRVHNSLTSADGPAATDDTVEVRARTLSGDIVIRRS